ncbi:MAG: class I SAM-dependent methyltransferase [Candidatus Sericytochromatia bacterium]|nr:class I SAM-dependent methyltransferase [Candidatus Sericytochromatia bacterium]
MKSDSGERLVLDSPASSREEHLNRLVHLAAYEFAVSYCREHRVLDLGTGTGYGAARVAEVAREVVAVDICEETLQWAGARFQKGNLKFEKIQSEAPLPFASESFDTVLSFQVIEHVSDPMQQIREIRRVLKPGGHLVLVTPNREVRLFPFQRPWNRWHPREYEQEELRAMLASQFEQVVVKTMSGDASLIAPELLRYRRLRWLTLPVTLPLWPHSWRVLGLTVLRGLQRSGRKFFGRSAGGPFQGDLSSIQICAGAFPALNLVLIASRTPSNGSSEAEDAE